METASYILMVLDKAVEDRDVFPGTVYDTPKEIALVCPCGCGAVTRLAKTGSPRWSVIRANAKFSINPHIHVLKSRGGCGARFRITNGEVISI